jgi:two-component system response regulator WspF
VKIATVPPLRDLPSRASRPQLVAMGASAGGPAALAKVLSRLPKDFPAAILVVQHVDPQFTKGLVDWLSEQTKLRLRLARHGDEPKPGTVLLAGTEFHLSFISPGKVGYTAHPEDAPYRPSIDVLFKSIPTFWSGDVVGVVLTGMGRDGANGLQSLRQAGHRTIVQDQATSAVFGMPKAAIELKAASEVLPLDKIGPRLAVLLKQTN